MSEDKKKRGAAEKGLYIVLFVCVAIVGIASWAVLYSNINKESSSPTKYVNAAIDGVDAVKKEPEIGQESNKESDKEPEPDKEVSVEDVTVGAWQEQETVNESGETEPEKKDESKKKDEPEKKPEQETGNDDTKTDSKPVWPLAGTVEVSFSMNDLIYDKTMADWRTHDGIDIEAKLGTKVMAVLDGTVSKIYTDDKMGTTVVISHEDGLESIYSNLAGKPTVREGDKVSCGTVIGSVGDTAESETGEVNHLHFAMRKDGKSVDPTEYLPKR